MKTQTIKEALEVKVQEKEYRVYVIREGDTVFYIGQSHNIYKRLRGHLGYEEDAEFKPSPTGRFILKYAPQSHIWLFEQYTLKDCWDIVGEITIPRFWGDNWRSHRDQYIVKKAEEALIQRYRPCFNIEMNPDPTPLPQRYEQVYDTCFHLKNYRSK